MARPETLQKSLPGLRCILAYFWPHLRLYRRLVIGSLLALARAAIRKAPILVLDEPERLHSERTTLPITHDLSPAASAHVILYPESGRIVERGTHAELAQSHGRYATMHRRQTISPHSGHENQFANVRARP